MSGHPRAKRPTIRWRLTLAFGGIAFGTGTLIIAALYLFMRYVPTYIASQDVDGVTPQRVTAGPTLPSVPTEGLSETLRITDVSTILDTLLWAGIGILIVMTALAGLAGWIVSGRMVRPLARIAEAAKHAGEGRLDHRIALDGPQDEIRDLAETFDRTLDRLERAFSAHERFAANAAHELRTPLTATKTLLDIARAHPGSVDSGAVLEQIAQSNDRSISTVQALLALTSVEAARIGTSPVDLAAVTTAAAERVVPAGFPAELSISPAEIEADELLIVTLLDNLMTNAVRHNDERRVLTISTGTDAGGPWVSIENSGPELAPDELAKLTEPLYRTRRSSAPGHGLGLAIARTIADAHSARLDLAARDGGGLIASVRFPPGARR